MLLFLGCAAPQAYGDLVRGEALQVRQPDGTTADVKVWGDEFYRVVESLDGYTLVRDGASGFACYARLSADGMKLVSTGVRVEATLPPGLTLEKHLRINPAAVRAIVAGARARMAQAKSNVAAVAGGGEPLPSCIGDVRGITLLLDFSDEPGTIPPAEIDDFCNLPGYDGFGNNGSVRDYFYDVSDGNLTYTNYVTPAYYRALQPKSYYEDPEIEHGLRARELVIEALTALDDAGFDFGEYDANGDGYIDAVNCYYAGARSGEWAQGLWPHSWTVDFTADGVSTYRYQISDIRNELYLVTFCHENGHSICFWPDLYDYDHDSSGAGDFCLMSSTYPPKNPVEPCAYMKDIAGWTTTIVLTVPQAGLVVPSDSNFVYKYPHPTASNEYFLIENRQSAGRDSFLWDQGLAIWHVDTNGSNDYQQMTPTEHYLVTLIQADGAWDLEHDRNDGDSTDLWAGPDQTAFADQTRPDALWWDGSDSGLLLSNFSENSALMTFDFGLTADCNGNGQADGLDIALGTSDDCNLNGVPDACDLAACTDDPACQDCNANEIPDGCDAAPREVYVRDDGSRESAIGVYGGGDLIWMNQFDVQEGFEVLNTVTISWGSVPDGTPATILIYDDPDNDRLPYDAVLIATQPTTVANRDTKTFNPVPIEPTNVGAAGDSFFVGAYITHTWTEAPASGDADTRPGSTGSWIAMHFTPGGGDIENLYNNDLPPMSSQAFPIWLIRAGLPGDCTNNGIPDDCDIAQGLPDDNANGIPDECDCPTMSPPTLVAEDRAKSRYLTLVPGHAGEEVALRVTCGTLDGFPSFEGTELWVGPPASLPEEDASQPGRTFVGASLQCEPHFRDWGTIDVLQIYGGEVMPGSSYQIQTIHATCAAHLGTSWDFGAPLECSTGKWGDAAPLFEGDDAGAPQPDFNDIASVVAKFTAAPSAPSKARAQLQPNTALPMRPVDFKDIAADVAAFVGTSYKNAIAAVGPCPCPSSVTCGATACLSDNACDGGYCIDGFCTDACGRCTPL